MYRLLSHNDLDGVGCGILAKLAFGKDVHVRYNSIASLNREVGFFLENGKKDTFLFVTDLSVNEDNEQKLEAFYQAGGRVQLLDHHKTALHFNEYEWGHVVVEDSQGKLTSATSLFYEYLVDHQFLERANILTEFVELVRQYDTWEWEKNDNQTARQLNALFFLISIDEFEDLMLERLQTGDDFYFDDFEKKILGMEDHKIERYIRRKKRQVAQKKIGDHYAGIVHAESYHSELGNELGKEYPHLDYIVILNMGGKRAGFRTIHDHVDVSEVAGRFDGGGHAKASGCTLTDEAYKLFVADTFQLETLREDAKRNRYNTKGSLFGSMYTNRAEVTFLIYPDDNGNWVIERNRTKIDQTFTSFEEAEKFLKRNDEAWLAKDELFVSYLMEKLGRIDEK
ncbi:DHH family phosphoesterase [Oceanobacillus rekensis]|uniref:DHH family phosphoesterase n=1 Tax=Oceanobacillus rekensis TaxID=937927 RepID=UPI000B4504D4|nr:oligoribonuclease [Oceanobacillus rekensis]